MILNEIIILTKLRGKVGIVNLEEIAFEFTREIGYEKIQHKNIKFYLFMPYYEKTLIIDHIQNKPTQFYVQFAFNLLTAIKVLSEMKIVHLDLKPSNIMLDDQMYPVLIDFGISKQGKAINGTILVRIQVVSKVAAEQPADDQVLLAGTV